MKKLLLFVVMLVALLALCSCARGDSPDASKGKSYTVSFEPNGGTAVESIVSSSILDAPLTDRVGYIFDGWYLDEGLTKLVSFPCTVTRDVTLYAKWIDGTDTLELGCASVQFSYDDSYKHSADYSVIPENLDLTKLVSQGYYVKLDVTYEVYYEKDFDNPFDFGYFGAPDHDALLVDGEMRGVLNKDLPTLTVPTEESLTMVISAGELASGRYFLKLITYNMQNIVHFKNIKIEYTCQRAAE